MYRSINTICRNPNTNIYKTEVLVGNYNLDDFNKQTKLF